MTVTSVETNRILQAIECLKAFDRRGAVALLREELAGGQPSGVRWRSVAQLAANIGELKISHEAARRFAATQPLTLERKLDYCRELTRDGLAAEALQVVDSLPSSVLQHSSVLHFKGTIFVQLGDFVQGETLFRQALAQTPLAPQTWFSLSVIKTFLDGDPDITKMEQVKPQMMAGPPRFAAQFCYAMGKAYDDIGDTERAFAVYSEGAAIMDRDEPFALESWQSFARNVVNDYAPEKINLLTRSACDSERVMFVNGAPRSGTTLVEQILTSHSHVTGGAELNLLRAALIPAGDYSLLGALNYQIRAGANPDPWGDLGRDYLRMLDDRFGHPGRVVDKTLNHSRMMGLLLHTLPQARMIWLRRSPEDNALSCFRTFFTAPMPWSWSAANIAAYFRSEDMLYAHWATVFPDRILTVPYEDLTADPQLWIGKICKHVGLTEERQVFEPHKSQRSVMTASVAQVRRPISTSRIGAAGAYSAFTKAFQRDYYG